MKFIEQLRKRLGEIVTEMRTAMEADDETRFAALEAEMAELETKLQSAEEREKKLLEATQRAEAAQAAGRVAEEQRNEQRGRVALGALQGKSRVEVSTEDRARFGSLGEQVLEAHFYHMNKRWKTAGVYEARAAAGYAEIPNEKGGLLLQEDLVVDLEVKQITEPGIIERCRQFVVSGNGLRIPRPVNYDQTSTPASGVSTVAWMGETSALTPAAGKFEQRKYELKKVGAIVPISNDLLEDAMAMESMIRAMVPRDIRHAIQDAILNGNDPSRPGGVLYADATVTQAKEENQEAATVVFENIVKMWSRMLPSSKPNSVWVMHPDVVAQLQLMNVAVGTGGLPVFLPPTGAAGAPYGTLFGRPIIEDQNCQALGTEGDIYLADFSEYNLVRKASGIKQAFSTELYFTSDQSAMRFIQRIDGAVYPSSAYTLAHGSLTRGSFITLATRS